MNTPKPRFVLTWMAACSLGFVTVGCSTVKNLGVAEDDRTVEIKSVKADEIPAWFLEKEADNARVLTVTATDISKDMQFAIDKATLNAKVQLAQKIGTTVKALVRETATEAGYGEKEVDREIDRASKSVTNQKIGFYRRENLKVVREGSNYRAYVMLRLSLEEGRRLTEPQGGKASREEKLKELEMEDAIPQVVTAQPKVVEQRLVTPVVVQPVQ